MKRLRTGNMKHLIDFEKQSSTQNDFGELLDSWTKIKSNVWCSVQTYGAKESISGNVEQSVYVYKFRTHYDPSIERINNSHRIIFKGRTLDIIHVENLHEMDRELIITAEERD